MYVVESKAGAIGCMILSLCCLGSWPAILTLLERRGRLPQHTFLDFATANLLAAIVIAFSLGEIGKSTFLKPDFTTQLPQVWFVLLLEIPYKVYMNLIGNMRYTQDNWPSVLLAVAGGVLLSIGNLATQYAFAFVGLSVTEVITASITVVIGILPLVCDESKTYVSMVSCVSRLIFIGTTLNYFLDNKINKAEILFPGVCCFLIAVFLGAAVHASNAADVKEKLKSLPSEYKAETN